MCTPTTSPKVTHACAGAPSAPVSRSCWVHTHSKLTRLSATRGTDTFRDGPFVSPASSNSSTPGGTVAEVAFMRSASSRVTRFHVNSPVCATLLQVSFGAVEENPMIGGS